MYLTACQPFLMQRLLRNIWFLARENKLRDINRKVIDQAITEDDNHLQSLWEYAHTPRRRFILAILQGEEEGDAANVLSFARLKEGLHEEGIAVNDETLIDDLEFLKELEVVTLENTAEGHVYRLSIPLMGLWISTHHDFDVVRRLAEGE